MCVILLVLASASAALSQQYDQKSYSAMKWRLIGPFRAGRVTAVSGVSSEPNTFYIGTPGGGVWKTEDAGQVWKPIFDQMRVASIGALSVSPSSPNVIYVGTGEEVEGNGVYKSTDAGATWTNTGLNNMRIITGVLVDPHNPNLVLVGVQGSAKASNDRGVFKSTDGGKSWTKTLFKDDKTAVMDLCWASDDTRVAYAATWMAGNGRGVRSAAGPDSAIYRSTDQGSTWQIVGGKGLPASGLGRIGVAAAPGTGGKTVFAIMTQGLFVSRDGGDTWEKSTTDSRIEGTWYFSRVFVDPSNANNVYVAQTAMYRSTDGGKTFAAYQGAPSGDDYHVLWIDPANSRHIIMGVDQGAVISVDGGQTWSSWYNQPTGQFYHVSTDNVFPYRAYAAQQDSGTAAVISRSDYGEITFRDWFSVAGFEACFIVPDPNKPNIIYAGGWYGSVVRFDRNTGQYAHVFVPGDKYRTNWDAPLVLSPQDSHTLYFGAQAVLKTTDEGMTWHEISPDLTVIQNDEATAPTTAPRRSRRPGVLTAVAPSKVAAGEIWSGANTGVIQITRDNGATWKNVSPTWLPSVVAMIEPSSFDPATAYAVLNFTNGTQPVIYRTHDYGHSWRKIVQGLPDFGIARVVREDPTKKGLLYAGTETGVFVSFDEGDHWQSLELNLPSTSVRDLDVHGSDLVAATFGRALWVLDDLTPLRQVNTETASASRLYAPEPVVRARWDVNQDTPLPAETPAGSNPPDGAIIDYYLKSPATDLRLDIFDAQNRLIRSFTPAGDPGPKLPPNAPEYWFANEAALSTHPGLNRFVWDLRYPRPETLPYGYYGNLLDYVEYTLPDHAIPGETPRYQPMGALVAPGSYKLVLTVGGASYSQTLTVKRDPRIQASQNDFDAQSALAESISAQMKVSAAAFRGIQALRDTLAQRRQALPAAGSAPASKDEIEALRKRIIQFESVVAQVQRGFGVINRDQARLITMAESADVHPSTSLVEAASDLCTKLAKGLPVFHKTSAASVASINSDLVKLKIDPIKDPVGIPDEVACPK